MDLTLTLLLRNKLILFVSCVIALEYVGSKWRTFVANMCTAIYFAAGALLMPWIALWISNWRMLSIVLSAPLMMAIFTPWIVPESVRSLSPQNYLP